MNEAIRKAAILIASLDTRSADALLEQMTPEQAARVRRAVMELDHVSPAEQNRVIGEFMRAERDRLGRGDDGVELDESLARRLASAPPSDVAPAAPREKLPFRFLHEATGELLAPYLIRENPQTIAVIVSHLPPPRAADVLTRLPAPLQAEVVRRIVHLESTDPQVLQEIERELESLLSEKLQASRRRSAGLKAIGEILGAAGQSDRREILANLSARDPSLAGQLGGADRSAPRVEHVTRQSRKRLAESPAPSLANAADDGEPPLPRLQFEELGQLDDRSLELAFAAAGADVAILALAGAPPQLIDRLLRRLAPREARTLRQRIYSPGPVPLRDIERAQAQVALAAERLARRGEIIMPPRRTRQIAA